MDEMTMQQLSTLLKERGMRLQLRWSNYKDQFEAATIHDDGHHRAATGYGNTIGEAVKEALNPKATVGAQKK